MTPDVVGDPYLLDIAEIRSSSGFGHMKMVTPYRIEGGCPVCGGIWHISRGPRQQPDGWCSYSIECVPTSLTETFHRVRLNDRGKKYKSVDEIIEAARNVWLKPDVNKSLFKIGDVVSRCGRDEQLVYGADNDYGNVIDVIVIGNPNSYEKLGDVENNMAERYTFKYHLVNWKDKLRELGREDLIDVEKTQD